MISPVERYSQEELDEDIAYRTQPLWFKFYYKAWLQSTAGMTAEQRGWYIRLLTAAADYDPVGYLPDDDDELKEIAGFNLIPEDIQFLEDLGETFKPEMIHRIKIRREVRWKKVRNKFVSSQDTVGYVYNRRLLSILQAAYHSRSQKNLAGRLPGTNLKTSKPGTKPALGNLLESQEVSRYLPENLENPDAGHSTVIKDNVSSIIQHTLQEKTNSEYSIPNTRESSIVVSNNNTSNIATDQSYSKLKEKKVSSKRDWISNPFQLTGEQELKVLKLITDILKMEFNQALNLHKLWLEEFVDYWTEMKNADIKFHQSKAKKDNWYMTYRRRVESRCYQVEIRKIGSKGYGSSGQTETVAQRNARLEREAEEYTRQLRSRSSGDNQVNTQRIPFESD